MFLLVLADVLVDLEESFNLDESAFLQQVQLGAVGLGGHLDVLQGRDLLLVAVLVLLGGTDGEWEPCAIATKPVTVKLLLVAIIFNFKGFNL